MAKRGTKEPAQSEFIDGVTRGMKRPHKDEPGHTPCWWSKYGHTDPSMGVRAKHGSRKYRENYDNIEWDE